MFCQILAMRGSRSGSHLYNVLAAQIILQELSDTAYTDGAYLCFAVNASGPLNAWVKQPR